MKCAKCGNAIERGYSVRIKMRWYSYCLNCKTKRQAEVAIDIRRIANRYGLDTSERAWCDSECSHRHIEADLLEEIWRAAISDEWQVVEHLFDVAYQKTPA